MLTRMAPLLTRMARMDRMLTRMTRWLAGSHIIHTHLLPVFPKTSTHDNNKQQQHFIHISITGFVKLIQ